MFEDSLIESGGKLKTKKGTTVLISTAVHLGLIVVLVLIPLIGLRVVGCRRWCGRFLRIGQHACSSQQAGKQANLNCFNKMFHDYPLTFRAADNVSAHPIRFPLDLPLIPD